MWLTDTAGYRSGAYHCRDLEDTPATLNLGFAEQVGKVTIAAVARALELAD